MQHNTKVRGPTEVVKIPYCGAIYEVDIRNCTAVVRDQDGNILSELEEIPPDVAIIAMQYDDEFTYRH